MIQRHHYLDLLDRNKNNGFPKVITGIRRCGKPYLLKEIYAGYLLDSGISEDQILILELDDDRNLKYRNPIELGKYIREFCAGKKDCCVFLDEIQLVNILVIWFPQVMDTVFPMNFSLRTITEQAAGFLSLSTFVHLQERTIVWIFHSPSARITALPSAVKISDPPVNVLGS